MKQDPIYLHRKHPQLIFITNWLDSENHKAKSKPKALAAIREELQAKVAAIGGDDAVMAYCEGMLTNFKK